MRDTRPFSDLFGHTIVAVEGLNEDSNRVFFVLDDGTRYLMEHIPDCCESVNIEDIAGDVADIIGSPVVQADERASTTEWPADVAQPEYPDDSFTWTFYRLATIKGQIVIRWYGSSNGYYSESVDFVKCD